MVPEAIAVLDAAGRVIISCHPEGAFVVTCAVVVANTGVPGVRDGNVMLDEVLSVMTSFTVRLIVSLVDVVVEAFAVCINVVCTNLPPKIATNPTMAIVAAKSENTFSDSPANSVFFIFRIIPYLKIPENPNLWITQRGPIYGFAIAVIVTPPV